MANGGFADRRPEVRGALPPSRRHVIEGTSAAALYAVAPANFANVAAAQPVVEFKPKLFASADELWAGLEAMNNLGPRCS